MGIFYVCIGILLFGYEYGVAQVIGVQTSGKGDVTIENSGADYEKAVAFAHSKSDRYPAKNLLKIRIKEIYCETPGPGAGVRV